MKIKKVILKNYRQYRDVNLEFKGTRTHDLEIILGKNGIGKTNFLNALTWCFYGDESHLGDKNSSIPIINTEVLESMAVGEECSVEVKIDIETNEGDLSFLRKEYFRKNGLENNSIVSLKHKNEFTATKSLPTGSKIFLDDDARMHVNRIIPEKINKYFFFDGEQLDSYFFLEHEDKIKQTIFEISQVQLLTRVKERLLILKKDYQSSIKDNQEINTLIDQRNNLENIIKHEENEINILENQIWTSKFKIKEAEEFLKGEENVAELEDKLKILMDEKKELDAVLENNKEKIKKMIIEYFTIIKLYPSVKQLNQLIRKKESDGELPPNVDKVFLESMISNNKCLICDRSLDDSSKRKIESIISSLSVSSQISHLMVSIKSDLSRVVDKARNYPEIKKELFSEKRRLEQEIENNDKNVAIINSRIQKVSNKEKVKEMHEILITHRKLCDENLKKLGEKQANYKNSKLLLEGSNKKIDSAMEKNKRYEKIRKLVSCIDVAVAKVKAIEEEMMKEVKNEIEKLSWNYFQTFLWKVETFRELLINDDYHIDLIHRDGYSCIGSCSAAERALLALSFTLALHKVSGFEAPLIIDTPLSRVSDEHRLNFAKVLKQVCEVKQIILFLTPSEYSPEVLDVFMDIVDKEYELKMTNDEKTTYVELREGLNE